MKWSMLWDLSVHNMSLPFDHTCCLDKSELGTCLHLPVSENRSRKLPSESFFLFPSTSSIRCCPCFSLLVGFFGFFLTLGIFASKGSSSSPFPISTSARDSPIGPMSSPIGATSRFRVFVGLTSSLLCHLRFPTADSSSQDNDQHRSHCWSLSISLLGSGTN